MKPSRTASLKTQKSSSVKRYARGYRCLANRPYRNSSVVLTFPVLPMLKPMTNASSFGRSNCGFSTKRTRYGISPCFSPISRREAETSRSVLSAQESGMNQSWSFCCASIATPAELAFALTGPSQLAVAGHLHVGRLEAQLHVPLVSEHRPVGKRDADEVLRLRALAEQALAEGEAADLLHGLLD